MTYCYQQSLCRCTICHDLCVQQQSAACGATPTIVNWSERLYCYAMKTDRRRIRSQVRPHNGADISELQASYYMTPVPWTWLLCSVSVFPENKLLLQEWNQLIEIELFMFSRKFWFLVSISRHAIYILVSISNGQMPVYPPVLLGLANSWASLPGFMRLLINYQMYH